MEQAKISIIVPVYQVEKYLRRCLDSIINQTYWNLEIILIEDGSTDDSPAICAEYAKKDSRIKVFYQKNQGSSVARNKGLDMATGDYVGFVDSDDWIETTMYAELYSALVGKHADIAVTGCYWETTTGTRALSLAPDKYYDAKTVLEGTIIDQQPSTSALWSKLFVKKCFEGIRFVPGVRSQDNICMVEILGKNPIVTVLQGCLYHYNKVNVRAVTKQTEPRMEYGYFIFLQRYLQLPSEFLQNQNVTQQIKADILKRAVRCYIENLVVPQISEERLLAIDRYLLDEKNYRGVKKLKIRHRILCWVYRNCKGALDFYAKVRYGHLNE